MRKSFLSSFVFVFTLTLLNVTLTYAQMKVLTNGDVFIPGDRSYWISGTSDAAANRLRLHHNNVNAYIDFAPNLFFRTGTVGAMNNSMSIYSTGLVEINKALTVYGGLGVRGASSFNDGKRGISLNYSYTTNMGIPYNYTTIEPINPPDFGVDNFWIGTSTNTFDKVFSTSFFGNYYGTNSDEQLKENIDTFSNSLSIVKSLQGVRFNYKNKQYKGDKKLKENQEYGFIAQDVIKVIPSIVQQDDSTGYYSVDYGKIVPFLVEAIKQQQEQIETYKKENEEIKNALNDISKHCCKKNTLKSAVVESQATGLASNTAEVAVLYQNNPNPFTQQTQINYYLPETTHSAILYIYDMTGVQLKSYPLFSFGNASLTISAAELKPGMFLYSLVADGKEVDTKRMIITN